MSLPMEQRPKKLMEQVQDAIRLKHYSYKTEKSYVGWIRRYIFFHDKRHPKDMGTPEIESFLTDLAVNHACCCFHTESSFKRRFISL
jgi:Phage integrase, N-terminal SAM-like domain